MMNLDELNEEEVKFLKFLLDQVTLEARNPEILKLAQICDSLGKKFDNKLAPKVEVTKKTK